MTNNVLSIFLWAVGYLSGSLCSAVIVSALFDLPDPRTKGSKNPGATNVLRLSGRKYAVLVLLMDMLKALLPVLLAKVLGASVTVVGLTCFAAVMGHMYPVFFKFKGGKGVATAMGALLGFHFILGVTVIATWLVVANFMRYASLASLIAMALAPLYAIAMCQSFDAFPPIFLITLFVFYQHRDNITRLMDGREPKLVFQTKALNEAMNGETITTARSAKKSKKKVKVKKVQAAAKKPKTQAKKTALKPKVKAKAKPKLKSKTKPKVKAKGRVTKKKA